MTTKSSTPGTSSASKPWTCLHCWIPWLESSADFKFPEQQDHSGNIWEILDEQVEDRYDVKGPFNHYNSEEYMDIEPGYVYQKRFNYVRKHAMNVGLLLLSLVWHQPSFVMVIG